MTHPVVGSLLGTLEKNEQLSSQSIQPNAATPTSRIEGKMDSSEHGLAPESDPQLLHATLSFSAWGHHFENRHELGVVNEYPEALRMITSKPPLSTSAFLRPAFHAVMIELGPSLITQVAAQLTVVTLRLVDDILEEYYPACKAQKLLDGVRSELKQAIPYYAWQGKRNCYAQAQYLSTLLEEVIRTLGVPVEDLINSLKANEAANETLVKLAQSMWGFETPPSLVYGKWTFDLLSAWPLTESEYPSDDEIPSPSTFVRSKTDKNLTHMSKDMKKRKAQPTVYGSNSKWSGQAENPLYISDNDAGPKQRKRPRNALKTPKQQAA